MQPMGNAARLYLQSHGVTGKYIPRVLNKIHKIDENSVEIEYLLALYFFKSSSFTLEKRIAIAKKHLYEAENDAKDSNISDEEIQILKKEVAEAEQSLSLSPPPSCHFSRESTQKAPSAETDSLGPSSDDEKAKTTNFLKQ
jgi:hypothetical protein